MSFDEDKEAERINVLCITAQGVCKTSLAAKFVLNFEDIKANCAFVASLCKRAGCDTKDLCLKASQATTGKGFTKACEGSRKLCVEIMKGKQKKLMEKMGMKFVTKKKPMKNPSYID